MFITLSQTPIAKLTQENPSGVSSWRGRRKAKQAAKKNENATNASLSAQQPAIDIGVSSDGKIRMANGGMEYKIINEWSKFATVRLSFPLFG